MVEPRPGPASATPVPGPETAGLVDTRAACRRHWLWRDGALGALGGALVGTVLVLSSFMDQGDRPSTGGQDAWVVAGIAVAGLSFGLVTGHRTALAHCGR